MSAAFLETETVLSVEREKAEQLNYREVITDFAAGEARKAYISL